MILHFVYWASGRCAKWGMLLSHAPQVICGSARFVCGSALVYTRQVLLVMRIEVLPIISHELSVYVAYNVTRAFEAVLYVHL
jgi:hypothetical protein